MNVQHELQRLSLKTFLKEGNNGTKGNLRCIYMNKVHNNSYIHSSSKIWGGMLEPEPIRVSYDMYANNAAQKQQLVPHRTYAGRAWSTLGWN